MGGRWDPEVGVLALSQLPCTGHGLQCLGFPLKSGANSVETSIRQRGGRQNLKVLAENLALPLFSYATWAKSYMLPSLSFPI